MLTSANKTLGGCLNSPISENDVDSESDDNANSSLFSWTQKKPENIETELGDFLKRSPTKKLETLNLTPTLKDVFIKYNTPLPSSDPVERVFSVGRAILSKKNEEK
ncbi:unnamed protein product [Macrosiphum euphorbiae]|uniref:HAT C-terminal dimerisation domain-containing protein n=1 Tax=Macrosiphum euphorbiae TaxID=13131 RepID=A0AAV0WT46_9HEMI|nr:unnamed protein product [Macrosiphum euphorbiae]